MALWVCGGCSTKYSVGAPACPHCGSLEHYEEGGVMPKITRHGGATNAADGPQIVGAAWSDTGTAAEWPAFGERPTEPAALPEEEAVVAVSIDGVDQGPGVVDETLGGPFEPLPEAIEGDTAEHVSEPDYKNWTVAQLREALAKRELPTSGRHADLVARLRTHDEP
jgi:SAP domain-containing protein